MYSVIILQGLGADRIYFAPARYGKGHQGSLSFSCSEKLLLQFTPQVGL